jgi:hypothetical protein
MARNNGIVTGALSTHEMSVVGPGLIPHPRIDRELLGLTPSRRRNGSARPSESSGHGAARRAATSRAVTTFAASRRSCSLVARERRRNRDPSFQAAPGDVLALKIQLVEAARVCNPNLPAQH